MLSLILIISLLAGLSSCGDSSSEDTTGTPTTTSAPEETKRDDLPDDLDFAGAEIKFLCRDSDANSGYRNELDFTEEDGDLVNDAIYKRNLDVQERLNVKFTMQTVNGSWGNRNEYLGLVRDSVLAGDDAYDIVVGYEAYIPTLAVEHLVKNLHDIPYIDFDKPWWNKRLLESNTIGGKCYIRLGRHRTFLHKLDLGHLLQQGNGRKSRHDRHLSGRSRRKMDEGSLHRIRKARDE